MDKTIRKVTDLVEQQAEVDRYWASRPDSERFEATWELSRDAYRDYYRQNGIIWDEEKSDRSITRIQRPER
jgi:hypothetical protein